MKKRLEHRLKELKGEFESGQKMLVELESKQASVRETMLRISGAIQVLEEELAQAEETELSPVTSTAHTVSDERQHTTKSMSQPISEVTHDPNIHRKRYIKSATHQDS